MYIFHANKKENDTPSKVHVDLKSTDEEKKALEARVAELEVVVAPVAEETAEEKI